MNSSCWDFISQSAVLKAALGIPLGLGMGASFGIYGLGGRMTMRMKQRTLNSFFKCLLAILTVLLMGAALALHKMIDNDVFLVVFLAQSAATLFAVGRQVNRLKVDV